MLLELQYPIVPDTGRTSPTSGPTLTTDKKKGGTSVNHVLFSPFPGKIRAVK